MDGHDIASRRGGAAFVAVICNTHVVRMCTAYTWKMYICFSRFYFMNLSSAEIDRFFLSQTPLYQSHYSLIVSTKRAGNFKDTELNERTDGEVRLVSSEWVI